MFSLTTLQQGRSSSQIAQNPGAIKELPRQSLRSPTRENPIMFHRMKAPVSRLWLKDQASDQKSSWGHQDLQWPSALYQPWLHWGNNNLRSERFKNREAEGQRRRGWKTMNETSDSQHATKGITRGSSRRYAVKHQRRVCLKRHRQRGNFSPLSTAEQNLTWVWPHRKGWGNTATGFPCNEGTVQRRRGLAGQWQWGTDTPLVLTTTP